MMMYTRQEICKQAIFYESVVGYDLDPDSDFHLFKKNKIAVKRAGCLRGGFDGTFIAARYVGNGGDALFA